MKCFLRTNSEEIRNLLEKVGISVCVCAAFPQSEWLVHSSPNTPYSVHGVYPADDDEPERVFFGNKDNFKEVFLQDRKDYVDCMEDVELFIKTIKESR